VYLIQILKKSLKNTQLQLQYSAGFQLFSSSIGFNVLEKLSLREAVHLQNLIA